jgi:hypothetical protein
MPRIEQKSQEPMVRKDAFGNDYVLAEFICEYLKQYGYRVVRRDWDGARPWLIVTDVPPTMEAEWPK